MATLEDAFIVQVGPVTPMDSLKIVLESKAITKAGFGLKSDRGPLQEKLGLRIAETVDLSHALRKLGYRQAVGVKAAVAIVLGRRLQKSRAISTSNWSLPTLSAKQLRYAAGRRLAPPWAGSGRQDCCGGRGGDGMDDG